MPVHQAHAMIDLFAEFLRGQLQADYPRAT
jgi:hypothetical protein